MSKRVNRPKLKQLDECETALIWNPNLGFRLYNPDRAPVGNLTLPETFLNILHMQINEELMLRVMNEYLSNFRRH